MIATETIHTNSGISLSVPRPVPVGQIVRGRSPEAVMEIVPYLFNLCRIAQTVALKLAFGMPVTQPERKNLNREILRENYLMLCHRMPKAFGTAEFDLRGPDTPDLARRLFGRTGAFPESVTEFKQALGSKEGVWPTLHVISEAFGPNEACCGALPPVSQENIFAGKPVENSVSVQYADHVVMRYVEGTHGRGPLWRILGRALDIQRILEGVDAVACAPQIGVSVVRAARGLFAISAECRNGLVSDFQRVTPTDHLFVRGGPLGQSFDSLPESRFHLADAVLEILDPCTPVRILGEVSHA